VAEEILRALTLDSGLVARAEVAGARYLNFFVAPAYWRQVGRVVRREGPAFGRSRTGCGHPVQVEFVSANPTGPLHVAHGRGAAVRVFGQRANRLGRGPPARPTYWPRVGRLARSRRRCPG